MASVESSIQNMSPPSAVADPVSDAMVGMPAAARSAARRSPSPTRTSLAERSVITPSPTVNAGS